MGNGIKHHEKMEEKGNGAGRPQGNIPNLLV